MTGVLPGWLRQYRRAWLPADLTAGVVVTLLLVPQSLAYALVAGLPAQAGLYASVVPLVLYALAGRSHAQSVGPMAVTSLLTAATLSRLAEPGSADYLALAAWLALLSGGLLYLMGRIRMGFIADALSRPVLEGFTAASAVLIVVSQLGPLVGLKGGGATLPAQLAGLFGQRESLAWPGVLLGGAALLWLVWARNRLRPLLQGLGLRPAVALLLSRTAPIVAVAAGIAMVTTQPWATGLPQVGPVPRGLPLPDLPALPAVRLTDLALPAFFIALVNYVQSLSVAQLLAAPRRETVDPEAELRALGLANLGAGFFGGFPVTGGLSRSLVNAEAGAQSQLASLVTAAGLALVMSTATGLLTHLPLAVLAATIVAAVGTMTSLTPLRVAWGTDRADAAGFAVTFLAVLLLGVDTGIVAGIVVSLAVWLARTGRPHIAELGRLPGSEHFRNVERFDAAATLPGVLFLRVDESLYFGNARHVREAILQRLDAHPVSRLVLVMSAVNRVDMTAVSMLQALDDQLACCGVALHLAEVKGPVAAVLERAGFPARFGGRVWLSAGAAWDALAPAPDFHI
ncbi:SulP family inorganic anion transporter [Gulbenkiania mobilis]|uniref:SulP family inorganic anion transporter n=1 Tax=Gulbenkiania mobilis TaxID=397457 RepID=UPI0006BBC351|nr:SulP family inorganic anion transporter [Gulbenkiania mobilis]